MNIFIYNVVYNTKLKIYESKQLSKLEIKRA